MAFLVKNSNGMEERKQHTAYNNIVSRIDDIDHLINSCFFRPTASIEPVFLLNL